MHCATWGVYGAFSLGWFKFIGEFNLVQGLGNKTHIQIRNISLVYIYYKNIYTAHSFFLSTQPSWRHSIKAVQQAVLLIATYINDKALKMIKKN